MPAAAAGRQGAGVEKHGGLHGLQGDHGVEQRDFHLLADAVSRARLQGGDDTVGGSQSAGDVGEIGADRYRRAAFPAGGADDAGHALQQQVLPGAGGERAVLAVAGERAVDERRIERAQAFGVEAEPGHDAGPEIVDERIAAGREAADDFLALGPPQIDGEAAFVAVAGEERGAVAVHPHAAGLPRRVTRFAGFDLDDVGAHVGQHLGTERAENVARQIEHADAVEGLGRTAEVLQTLAFELVQFGFEGGDAGVEGLIGHGHSSGGYRMARLYHRC